MFCRQTVEGYPVLARWLFWNAGNAGVVAFFVLSGFLLSLPFWRAFREHRPRPDLRVYALRRLARIVPGFVFCVLLLAVITGQFHTPAGRYQVGTCLTFCNWLFPATYMPEFDGPLWSISVEMTFYALLVLLVLGMFRCRRVGQVRGLLAAVLTVIIAGQVGLMAAAPRIEHAVANPALFAVDLWTVPGNPVYLFAHFLMGFLAADIYLALGERRSTAPPPAGPGPYLNRYDLLAAGLMILPLIIFDGRAIRHVPFLWRFWPLPWELPFLKYNWPMLPLIFALILVSLAMSRRLGDWLDCRFLRVTATLSFGIYIWHVPLLTLLAHHWPVALDGHLGSGVAFSGIGIGLSYLVAFLSYRLIEWPVLRRAHQYQLRPRAHLR
jgi:peptidoglycan/LPS O-acetylase OafA/YrhL